MLDVCACRSVPADCHVDKSFQLEADIIMVSMESPLPKVPNSQAAILWFLPVCGLGLVQASQANK